MTRTAHDCIERYFRSTLKLPHLRTLVALADLGQVKRVAAAFHVTQPAISRQLAEIEGALGAPVVQRVGNAVEFTAIGKALAARGREVLRHIELAHRDVSALAAGTAGHVRLGAVVTVPPPLISQAIESFMQHAPHASVSFIEATLDKLIRWMDEGELDLALGRNRLQLSTGTLCAQTLLREPFVFVAGARHPLARIFHE